MLKKKLILSVIGGALLAISAQGFAAQQPTFQDEVVERRGADDAPGTERPGDNHRQRRGGRLSDDASDMILSRRGADDAPGTERPGDNHRQRRGGRNMIDTDSMILSRRGADDPPGTERPGDRHRQRRGGRA
jgi:hypothetical protein